MLLQLEVEKLEIEDSKIELYYNNKTEKYLTSTKNELNKVDEKKN